VFLGGQDQYHSFERQKALTDFLDRYVTSTSQPNQPCLWPLVKEVRIDLRGIEFLEYFTLVDVPGLGDIIQLRAKSFEEQVHNCDETWAVARSDRVTTDTIVDSVLLRYGASFPIKVICTAIDDSIDDSLADYLESEDQDVSKVREMQTEQGQTPVKIQRRRKVIDDTKRWIDETRANDGYCIFPNRNGKRGKASDQNYQAAENHIQKFDDEVKELQKRVDSLPQELFSALVKSRNQLNDRKLRQDKAAHLPKDTGVSAFYVSSRHYAALKGAQDIHSLQPSPEDTGIPELRH